MQSIQQFVSPFVFVVQVCDLFCPQEPCSPTADKRDAGLRKQSAPAVQHVIQANNGVLVPAHTDVRKADKGWAQFEEDCQGMFY